IPGNLFGGELRHGVNEPADGAVLEPEFGGAPFRPLRIGATFAAPGTRGALRIGRRALCGFGGSYLPFDGASNLCVLLHAFRPTGPGSELCSSSMDPVVSRVNVRA